MTMDLSAADLVVARERLRAAYRSRGDELPDWLSDDARQAGERITTMAKCQWCESETPAGKACRACGLSVAQAKQAAEGLQREADKRGVAMQATSTKAGKRHTKTAQPMSSLERAKELTASYVALSERLDTALRCAGVEFGKEPTMTTPKDQHQVLAEITAEARKAYPGLDAHEATKRYFSEHPDAWGRYRNAPATAYINDPATGRLVLAEAVQAPPTPLTATEAERRFKDNPKGRGHAQAVVDSRVRAAMAGSPKLSFGEAAAAVFAADPELYQRYRSDAVARF
jgi:hypothetical protein